MKRVGEAITAVALGTALVTTGCTAEIAGSSSGRAPSQLYFDKDPSQNKTGGFASLNCTTGDGTGSIGGGYQVSDKGLPETMFNQENLYAVVEQYGSNGYPEKYLAGAIVRVMGGFTLEIAASDDPKGTTTIVDVQKETYSRTIQVNDNYAVNISARLAADNLTPGTDDVYVSMTCLPNFGYSAEATPVPLPPPISSGSATPTPSPSTRGA